MSLQLDVTAAADDTGVRGTPGSVVSTIVGLALLAAVSGLLVGVLGLLWHGGLVLLATVVDLPVVTLGVAELVGVRPVVRGVPVLYAASTPASRASSRLSARVRHGR